MRGRVVGLLLVVVGFAAGSACSRRVALYCDEATPCDQADTRPYCDVRGVHPDSEGVARTCVATPLSCVIDQACEARDDGAGICRAPGWCAFVDASCPSGERWSTLAGDGLAGTCVAVEVADAGPPDAGIPDAAVVDAAPPDASIYEDMVLVEEGPFLMGCDSMVEMKCPSSTIPYHSVFLSSFYIDRYEVSQERYAECVTAGACNVPAANWDPDIWWNYPVTDVQYQLAFDYCAWAGKRLPTEAEWEKAARGADGRKYAWGNTPAPDCTIAPTGSCPIFPVAVDSHPEAVSPYGAFHMSGNVNEWVNDWYASDYYSMSPPANPPGASSGIWRVIRGELGVVWRRAGQPATLMGLGLGFRCAISAS